MTRNTNASNPKARKSLREQFQEWKNRPREKMPMRRKVFLAIAIVFGLLAFTEVLGKDEKGWWFLCFTVAVAFFLLWFPDDEDKKKNTGSKKSAGQTAQSQSSNANNAAALSANQSKAGSAKASRKKFKN